MRRIYTGAFTEIAENCKDFDNVDKKQKIGNVLYQYFLNTYYVSGTVLCTMCNMYLLVVSRWFCLLFPKHSQENRFPRQDDKHIYNSWRIYNMPSIVLILNMTKICSLIQPFEADL